MTLRLLAELLHGPRKERELRESMDDIPQPTLNRKLSRLEEAGLIRKQSLERKSPWQLAAAAETEQLLTSVLSLADKLDERDAQERAQLRTRVVDSLKAPHLRLLGHSPPE